MAFRKMKGVKVPYKQQGLIYFTCCNFGMQTDDIRAKIRGLCDAVAGEYTKALFEHLVTGLPVADVAKRHYCDAMTLYRARKAFFERW